MRVLLLVKHTVINIHCERDLLTIVKLADCIYVPVSVYVFNPDWNIRCWAWYIFKTSDIYFVEIGQEWETGENFGISTIVMHLNEVLALWL